MMKFDLLSIVSESHGSIVSEYGGFASMKNSRKADVIPSWPHTIWYQATKVLCVYLPEQATGMWEASTAAAQAGRPGRAPCRWIP